MLCFQELEGKLSTLRLQEKYDNENTETGTVEIVSDLCAISKMSLFSLGTFLLL